MVACRQNKAVKTLKNINTFEFVDMQIIYMCVYIYIHTHTHTYTYIYTGCPRRNVPDFGRVFLMLKYTDITQNTYVQS